MEKLIEVLDRAALAVVTAAAWVALPFILAGRWVAREWRRGVMFLRVSAVAVKQCWRRLYRAEQDAAEAVARATRDPALTMSRPEAIAYVQHLAITYLEGELMGIRAVGEAATDPKDKADAALVCEEGANVVEALKRSNEVLMRGIHKVQPATAADLPRGVTRIR